MKFIQKIAEALKYTFADKKTVDEVAKHTTRPVLFYRDSSFTIVFEGKMFNSEQFTSNIYCIMLNIPFNVDIIAEQIDESSIEMTLDYSGINSLENKFGNNLILPIQSFIGEAQE